MWRLQAQASAGPHPSRSSSFLTFPLLNDQTRMDKEITRRIIDFALEIICLLSGEDYTIVRKTSGSPSPITKPSPISLIHEKKRKVLDLTTKITELLSGETLEDYGGHPEVMVDLLSPGGSKRRNPPEKCEDPSYSQDSPEENVPENHQRENLIDIKVEVVDEVEEPDFMAEQQYGLGVINPSEKCQAPLYSQDCPESHQGGDLTIIKVEAEDERMMEDQPCMSDVKEETPGDDTAAQCVKLIPKGKVTGSNRGAAMKKISQEKRNSIIQLIDSGLSAKKIAKLHHVSAMTVGRIRNEVRPSIQKPRGGRPGKISESTSQLITRSIRSGAASTAVEVARMLRNSEITDVHASTVRRTLHKSGMVARKKKLQARTWYH